MGKTCSFCNKTRKEVRLLVVGPEAIICDHCIRVAKAVLAGEAVPLEPPPPMIRAKVIDIADAIARRAAKS